MKNLFRLMNRTVLMLGVLVALTPCGICKNAVMAGSSELKACSAMPMNGPQDCCRSQKSREPFCKAMDQSSVAPVSHGTLMAAMPSVSAVSVATLLPLQVCAVPSVQVVSSSPPRGTLSLRI